MLRIFSTMNRRTSVIHVLTACCVLACLLVIPKPAAAEDIRQTSSLEIIPADASFYLSCLRNREKFDIVRNSKLVARLLELPPVQMGLAQLKEQWENPEDPQLAMVKELLKDPANIELLELLKDAVSHEVFIYGGDGFGELLQLTNELNSEIRKMQSEMMKQAPGPDALDDDAAGKAMLAKVVDLLDKEEDRFQVPPMVIGFKLSDSKRASTQIARLEVLLQGLLAEKPEFGKRLTREKVGDSEFLTFAADGSMIPWDEVPPEEIADVKEQFDRLRELVTKKTLTVSLGTSGDYLLLSISASNEHLESLGQGELLIDRPEFAGLRKFADKPITSIGYVSESFVQVAGDADRQIDDLAALIESAIPMIEADNFDPMVKARMAADVKELAKDLKQFIPEPGAAMGFNFLNGRGIEGYSYNWSENLTLDASQKLSILDHLGGDPLCFAAGRAKKSPENYALLVKWLKRGFAYWEALGVPQLEDDQRAMYDLVWAQVQPQLPRLDKATSELLIPAFKDGQTALVFDAKLKSKQWHKSMPPSEKPLPMLEVALVSGISDPDLVKRAASEYFHVVQAVLDGLHEAMPEQIPEIKLPKPDSREFPAGTVYYYKVARNLGLDFWLAPNAGLSDQFLVLSMLPKVTLRLLQPQPLQLDGPLTNVDRPLAAASHFDFAGTLNALQPWVEYGLQVAAQFSAAAAEEAAAAEPALEVEVADDFDDADGTEFEDVEIEGGGIEDLIEPKAILENLAQAKEYVQFGFDILRCFQSVSSVTYEEEGALVTHSEWRFQDLK